MTNTTYNGFKNYETWLVITRVANDESYYAQMLDVVREPVSSEKVMQNIRFCIMDILFEHGLATNDFIHDVVKAFLDAVDWQAVVNYFGED